MRKALLTALALSLTLSACARVADSRLNPFNWFGRDRSQTIEVDETLVTADGRQLVAEISELAVDPTPNGAIIRAVGLPPTQAFWDADLVRIETNDPSVVIYEFRVLPPVEPRAQSTQQSREIIAAAALSNRQLDGVRTIVVRGRSNERVVSR
jgi:hypothetical protein